MTLQRAAPGTGKTMVDDGRGVSNSRKSASDHGPTKDFAILCVFFAVFALNSFFMQHPG